MEYPIISEYIEAIEMAEDNLEALNYLRPVLDDKEHVVMSSGGFAVVFKMRDERDGKLYAIKCFLKEQEGRAEAYHKICEALRDVSTPYFTKFEYYDDELFVSSSQTDQETFPVLLMDWVEGVPLDVYVREHIDDEYELQLLTYRFGKMASWLVMQSFAHGDLKPDNILVTADGELKLVDYDGMYVPTMKGEQARELGSPDFRHPSRTIDDFDEHIDDFALVVIELSLKAISVNSSWLDEFGASDRLLFSEQDYRDISKCEALKTIVPSVDLELNRLAGLFYMVHSQMKLNLSDGNSFLLEDVIDYVIEEALGIDVDENYDFLIRFRNGCPLYLRFNKTMDGLIVCTPFRKNMGVFQHYYTDNYGKPYGKIIIPPYILFHNKSYKVVEIDDLAFVGCNLLNQIEISNSIQKIGFATFRGCITLNKVELSNSILELKSSVFERCILLSVLEIPNSIQKIGFAAFRSCTSLKQIIIPSSIKMIDDGAFEDTSVKLINYSLNYVVENKTLYTKDKKELLYIPNNISIFTIPNFVQKIANSAFYGCKLLEKIEIPNSVLEIGDFAFCGCRLLKQIRIPSSVVKIGDFAFNGCSLLKEAIVHNQNVEYEYDTFPLHTNLIYVDDYTIEDSPKGVKNINYDFLIRFRNRCPLYFKFGDNEGEVTVCAPRFRSIKGLQSSQYRIGDSFSIAEFMQMHHHQVFEASVTSRSTGVVVPGLMFGSVFASYSKNSGIHSFAEFLSQVRNMQIVQLINSGTGEKLHIICHKYYYANNEERSFENIQIPSNINYKNKEYKVVGIDKWAFVDCNSLVKIEIPNSVQDIGDYAFEDCTSLKEAILYNRNVKYKDNSFQSHTKIIIDDDLPF